MNKPTHVKPSFYAYNFQPLKEIACKYGYNLVLHGSLNRDLDLIAIPWADEIGSVDDMLKDICEYVGGYLLIESPEDHERFRIKKHGRACHVININRECKQVDGEWKDPQWYLDISVTPKI